MNKEREALEKLIRYEILYEDDMCAESWKKVMLIRKALTKLERIEAIDLDEVKDAWHELDNIVMRGVNDMNEAEHSIKVFRNLIDTLRGVKDE